MEVAISILKPQQHPGATNTRPVDCPDQAEGLQDGASILLRITQQGRPGLWT